MSLTLGDVDPSYESIVKHRRRVGWVLFVVAVILIIGWPIAVIANWGHIVSSHARLGYLIGDSTIVIPLCLATWYGFRKDRIWAPLIFLVAAGAGAFDLLHFGIYLIQEEFLSIPTPIYIVVLLICLAVIILWVRWEIVILTGALGRAQQVSESIPTGET